LGEILEQERRVGLGQYWGDVENLLSIRGLGEKLKRLEKMGRERRVEVFEKKK